MLNGTSQEDWSSSLRDHTYACTSYLTIRTLVKVLHQAKSPKSPRMRIIIDCHQITFAYWVSIDSWRFRGAVMISKFKKILSLPVFPEPVQCLLKMSCSTCEVTDCDSIVFIIFIERDIWKGENSVTTDKVRGCQGLFEIFSGDKCQGSGVQNSFRLGD